MSREIKLMQMITAIEYYVEHQPLPKTVEDDYREILLELRGELSILLQASIQNSKKDVEMRGDK